MNRGEVIVGNMGSEKRFNYTIMGDEVNFGSRLEGLTKKYAVECLISEGVGDELKGKEGVLIGELDCVTVKGKKEPKKIYELITGHVDERKKEALNIYEQGLVKYKAGEWDAALGHFIEGQKLGDEPSGVFVERVQEIKKHPPLDWKGVYEHTSK